MKSARKPRSEFEGANEFSRREALGALAGLPFVGGLSGFLDQQGGQGLVIREKDPENLEYPFETLKSYITPNDSFYVRSHFKVPPIELATWGLSVEGAVSRPKSFSYGDLLNFPSRTVTATLECAGNGRVFLSPTARGAQWELGAVSNAKWLGVPLSAVLEAVGVKADAVEVVLVGADSGVIKDEPKPPTAINFCRSIPLAKALQPEVVLAYQMNGETLPASHGYPLRAIVPGWYAVASVKWLSRIVVVERQFGGHFQTVDYAYWEQRNGLPSRVMISEMLIKSEIARPSMHEIVRAGAVYKMSGAAWTSNGEISRVEVSADGGKTWSLARLTGEAAQFAWQLWEYDWQVPSTPGKYTLSSRATDSSGRTQPLTRDLDRANYLINHVLPIDVIVRSS